MSVEAARPQPYWLRPLYDAYHALGTDRDPQWSVSIEVANVLVDRLSRAEASRAPAESPMVVVDAGAGFSSCAIRRWAADLPAARTLIFSTDLDAQYLDRAQRDAAALGFTQPRFILHGDLDAVLDRPVQVAFWDLGHRNDRMRRLGPFVDRHRVDQIVLDDWHREPDAKWTGYMLHERGYEVSREKSHVDQYGRYAGVARLAVGAGSYAQCHLCGLWGSAVNATCVSCRASS